jgi:hypothetical protein
MCHTYTLSSNRFRTTVLASRFFGEPADKPERSLNRESNYPH